MPGAAWSVEMDKHGGCLAADTADAMSVRDGFEARCASSDTVATILDQRRRVSVAKPALQNTVS